MRSPALRAWLLIVVLASSTSAQTFSNCNPLTSGSCPPDSALGRSVNIDFAQGASDSFTPQGNPTYDSNGASFTVAKSGDSPQLTSKWYIMFGHVEFVIKAAPGVGIVSSAVLQSDDLDEIDWEWLGSDNNQVQSNYFGKGQTTTYNRGAFHPDPNNQNNFRTYTIDWTADQIVWQIDGTTVRVLTQAGAAPGQYPQTPMQIKVGAWSGGDSSNAPGTIQWAGGATNYASGPYSMQVKSIAVTDYSTGTQYIYTGTSGNWQDIQAVGGSVNSKGGSGSVAGAAAPEVTSTPNSAPMPFDGTHRDTSSTYVKPNVYPWVADPTTLLSATATATTYPGLPSGWTVSSSGKVVPPSAAPSTSPPALPTSFVAVSPPASSLAPAGDVEVVVQYDQQGFPVTVTQPAGWSTASKSYDVQGFLITSAPGPSAAALLGAGVKAADTAPSSSIKVTKVKSQGAANSRNNMKGLGTVCGLLLCGAFVVI